MKTIVQISLDLISIPEAVYKGLVPAPVEHLPDESQVQFSEAEQKIANHRHAAALGILTIFVLVLWKTIMPRRLQLLPAQLVGILAVSVGAVASAHRSGVHASRS